MKILIVRPTPNKVNLSSYNLQEIGLAKALVRKGHICDVAYYCGKEKSHTEKIEFDKDKSINIHWLHGFNILREGIYPDLKKIAKNYDVIQVGGHESLTSCMLNRKFGDKVVNYQGPYYCKNNKGDIKKSMIFDKTILPLSHKKNMIVGTKSVLATDYLKSKGVKEVTTIGVGLDLSNIIKPNSKLGKNEFIETLKKIKKKNDKYLLYVGVLEDRRNIPFILEVLKEVVKINKNYKLIIVGKGKPEYIEVCRNLVKEYKLKDNIIYQERLEQKYMDKLYGLADAFLLPTKYEIFGMVLLEAMYFKLPVFTTYNGGSSTLMNDKNGVVINNFNSKEWADEITKLLENKKRLKEIKENAHKTIADNYTWDVLADKFLLLYNKRLKK